MKFKKKPIIVEAVQWDGNNFKEVGDLNGKSAITYGTETDCLTIETLEGSMKAKRGDWVIKGINGELYPCNGEIFHKTYEVMSGVKNNQRLSFFPQEIMNDIYITKPFYTYEVGAFINSIIRLGEISSYLELGVGFGFTAASAGLGLKANCHFNDYRLLGIDKKEHRLVKARGLCDEVGVKYEFRLGNATEYEPDELFDMVFIDTGYQLNQKMIDKVSSHITKCYVIHDIVEKLRFPDNFKVIYFPNRKMAFAYLNEEELIKK